MRLGSQVPWDHQAPRALPGRKERLDSKGRREIVDPRANRVLLGYLDQRVPRAIWVPLDPQAPLLVHRGKRVKRGTMDPLDPLDPQGPVGHRGLLDHLEPRARKGAWAPRVLGALRGYLE